MLLGPTKTVSGRSSTCPLAMGPKSRTLRVARGCGGLSPTPAFVASAFRGLRLSDVVGTFASLCRDRCNSPKRHAGRLGIAQGCPSSVDAAGLHDISNFLHAERGPLKGVVFADTPEIRHLKNEAGIVNDAPRKAVRIRRKH